MTQPEVPEQLHAEFAFKLKVELEAPMTIGPSKYGERRLIPITGGTIEGPKLSGEVMPGGADWQLTRPDGVLDVDARYTIRASDGALIHVRNRGIVAFPPHNETLYVRTSPQFEAPRESAHAWLNRSVFLGTIQLINPKLVQIGVFRVI